MKRRHFLTAGSAAAVTASAPAPVFAIGTRKRWRMAMSFGKTSPILGAAMSDFVKEVEQLSSGALKLRMYGAGELVPALGTFDAVKNGDIQLSFSAAYYWLGKIPASSFFTSVPFGMSEQCMYAWLAHGGGQELWDELMAPYGVQCLPCGACGYQPTGWFNKEIKSVKDLQGLKVRVPGLAGKVYAKAGASPVLIPGGEIFTALATGVVDAVEWINPYLDYTMGFQKAAKYYYGTTWHETGSILEMMINKQAFKELPKELQLLLRVCIAKADQRMSIEMDARGAEYLDKIAAEGKVEIKELPEDVLLELKKHADAVLSEVGKSSPLAGKIFSSYSNFQKKYESYQDWGQKNYFKAIRGY